MSRNTAALPETSRFFNLIGYKDESVWNTNHPQALPTDLRDINFAKKKLTDTTAEWSAAELHDTSGNLDDGLYAQNGEGLGLTKSEVIAEVVKILLKNHCKNPTGIEQAATLLSDVQDANIDLNLATGVVEAASPGKWPAKPLAQMLLGLLRRVLEPYKDSSLDPRPFKNTLELESQIQKILDMADTMLGARIQELLQPYFSEDVDISPSDYAIASRLLIFCSLEDTDAMSAVITALGSPLTPAAAISLPVVKLVKEHGGQFFDAMQEDLARRFQIRVMPSLFPISRRLSRARDGPSHDSGKRSPPAESIRSHESHLQRSTVDSKDRYASRSRSRSSSRSQARGPPRTPSPSPSRGRPSKGKQRAPRTPSSSRSPSHESPSRHHRRRSRRGGASLDRSRRASTPPTDVRPIKSEDAYLFGGFIPPSASAPSSPNRHTSPLPPPGGSLVVRHKDRTASKATGATAQPAQSARVSSEDLDLAYTVTKILTVGSGPRKFKWWNILLKSFKGIDDIATMEEPCPGDVLTYWNERTGTAGAFAYLADGWVNVTDDYFANTGKIHHPGFSKTDAKVLTWKKADDRQPTWVSPEYFRKKKSQYSSGMIITLSDYKKSFSISSGPQARTGGSGSGRDSDGD